MSESRSYPQYSSSAFFYRKGGRALNLIMSDEEPSESRTHSKRPFDHSSLDVIDLCDDSDVLLPYSDTQQCSACTYEFRNTLQACPICGTRSAGAVETSVAAPEPSTPGCDGQGSRVVQSGLDPCLATGLATTAKAGAKKDGATRPKPVFTERKKPRTNTGQSVRLAPCPALTP